LLQLEQEEAVAKQAEAAAKLELSPRAQELAAAGIVRRRGLTTAQIRNLNKLTDAEVRALLNIKRKVGRGSEVIGFFIF
jgi:hypothetical protein